MYNALHKLHKTNRAIASHNIFFPQATIRSGQYVEKRNELQQWNYYTFVVTVDKPINFKINECIKTNGYVATLNVNVRENNSAFKEHQYFLLAPITPQ